MDKIRYNEEQEAFEITYKLWDREMTVRFYAEDQQAIMNNLSEIARKLETVNSGKKRIAEEICASDLYRGSSAGLADTLVLESVYADIDEDEVVVCFTVDSTQDGFIPIAIEHGADEDIEFDIIGYSN